MTLMLEHLPESLTKALEDRAQREGRSVQEIALDALRKGLEGSELPKRDLSDIVGTWKDDPAFDQALKDFERVDAEIWQ